jgi:DNA-binding MarR family transcriptional regulator
MPSSQAAPGARGAGVGPGGAEPEGPRWLDAAEMEAWLGLLGLVVELPQALDRQLRAEAGIGHVYYSVLAVLSAAPQRRVALQQLAVDTGTSLSRLSHAIDALEAKGWVARRPAEGKRRQVAAVLTQEGLATLQRVAPGHVAEVRRLVFDRLSPDEVRLLTAFTRKLRPSVASAG